MDATWGAFSFHSPLNIDLSVGIIQNMTTALGLGESTFSTLHALGCQMMVKKLIQNLQ